MKRYVKSAIGDILNESTEAKREIARNPETDVDILNKLSTDYDSGTWVRWEVAFNDSTPPETLAIMSNDKEDVVRAAVACNPNTPVEVLEKLISDKDMDVRKHASENPNATPDMVERYNNDIESIKAEVSDYVKDKLSDNLWDFLNNLYGSIERDIPRYKADDWWDPDAMWHEEELISEKGFKELVDAVMFGKYTE